MAEAPRAPQIGIRPSRPACSRRASEKSLGSGSAPPIASFTRARCERSGPYGRSSPRASDRNKTITAGLLPPRIREEFGLRFGPADRLLYEGSLRALRSLWPKLPARL